MDSTYNITYTIDVVVHTNERCEDAVLTAYNDVLDGRTSNLPDFPDDLLELARTKIGHTRPSDKEIMRACLGEYGSAQLVRRGCINIRPYTIYEGVLMLIVGGIKYRVIPDEIVCSDVKPILV